MALALYRKYRPAKFAEVVGQEHVTEPLSTALAAGRINHAYLFSGPRGCGKTSSARILARSLNCEQGPTPDPCGVCASCVSLAPGGPGNIDVTELDAASHGGVDDTRELRDRAFFAPAESRYRVFIVDEAHMITTQGFNALLKIVEEPPEHLVFVFATTEPDKVLPTIRSRTHHYPFRLIPPGTLRALLERICADEGVVVAPAVYPLVIRAGGGSARDSLSVLDQLLSGAGPEGVVYERAVSLLGVTDVALIDDMVDALAADDRAAVFETVDRLVEAGHDPRRFAADLLQRLRDVTLLQAVPEAAERGLVEAADDELARIAEQAERIGPATLTRYGEIVHTGLTEMRGATAPRLLLELLCARMLLPAATTEEAGLLQRLERLERRNDIAAGPATAGEDGEGDDGRRTFRRASTRPAGAPAPAVGADGAAPPAATRRPAADAPARSARAGGTPVAGPPSDQAADRDIAADPRADDRAPATPRAGPERSAERGAGPGRAGSGGPAERPAGPGRSAERDAGTDRPADRGSMPERFAERGAEPDGAGSDGAGSDGAGSDGAGSDGAGSEGAVERDAGSGGVAEQDSGPGRSAGRDPGPDGAARRAAVPERSSERGAGPDGAGPVGSAERAVGPGRSAERSGATGGTGSGGPAEPDAGPSRPAGRAAGPGGSAGRAAGPGRPAARGAVAAEPDGTPPERTAGRRGGAAPDRAGGAAQGRAAASADADVPAGRPDGPPAAAPAPQAASLDAAAVRRVWPEILAAARTHSRSVEAMLVNATVRAVQDDVLVLGMGVPSLARRLSEPRNADVVSAALHAVLGVRWQVRCEHGDAPPPAPRGGGAAAPAPTPSRRSAPVRRSTAPDDGEPLPPEPPDEDVPPPVDEESMIAEAAATPAVSGERRDPEEEAIELLASQLGAKAILGP